MQLKFTHYNLGFLDAGRIVEVTLTGSSANVQLLNTANYEKFKAGDEYRYQGGLVKKSPVRLTIPLADTWHVTIDMRGLVGTVESVVEVLPETLPEFK